MSRILKSLLVVCVFTFCDLVSYGSELAEGVSVETFHVVVSGGMAQVSPDSIQGVSVLRDRFNIVEKGPVIPLLKGHGLAVTFTLGGKYRQLENVRLVVKYPAMKAPDGTVYSGIDRNQKSLPGDGQRIVAFSYAFDESWELVEGVWTVQIFDGESKLGETRFLAVKAPQPDAAAEPLSERLLSFCQADVATDDDLAYLHTQLANGWIAECLTLALLHKHAAQENLAGFRSYFSIDRTKPTVELPNDEINRRVNAILQEHKSRSAAEQMVRVYLGFRRTGLVAKRSDGTEMSLEVMFRASVFAAVNAGSKEKALQFAAVADGRSE